MKFLIWLRQLPRVHISLKCYCRWKILAAQHLYTLQSDHHSKCTNHLSPYIAITVLLIQFPVLYITSHNLFYNWNFMLHSWFCFITNFIISQNLNFGIKIMVGNFSHISSHQCSSLQIDMGKSEMLQFLYCKGTM